MTNVAKTAMTVIPKAVPTKVPNLPAVIQTASKTGGYGKLAAALVGLGVLGAATYLYCKKDGDAEKAN